MGKVIFGKVPLGIIGATAVPLLAMLIGLLMIVNYIDSIYYFKIYLFMIPLFNSIRFFFFVF